MKSDTMIEDLRTFAVSLRSNDMPRTGEVLEAAANEIERTRQLCRKLLFQLPCDCRPGFIPEGCDWLRDD